MHFIAECGNYEKVKFSDDFGNARSAVLELKGRLNLTPQETAELEKSGYVDLVYPEIMGGIEYVEIHKCNCAGPAFHEEVLWGEVS